MWKNEIEELYKNVFMRIDVKELAIKQAFTVGVNSPEGIHTIIDHLIQQGEFIRKKDFMK